MDDATYNEQALQLMAAQYAQGLDNVQQLHNIAAYLKIDFVCLLVVVAFLIAFGFIIIGQLKPKAP